MTRRQPIILIAVFISACGASTPPSPPSTEPSPRVAYAPQQASPEIQAEYLRLERIAEGWAGAARERHGLLGARCRIALEPGDRTSCGFEIDGISLHVMKTGRSPSDEIHAILSFSNRVEIGDREIRIVGGRWIGVGDVFEIEAGDAVYVHYCEALGEADYVTAQCRWARDFAEIAARATRPRVRYSLEAEDAQGDIGSALQAGTLRVLHNGAAIDLAPLIAATRDFARQDFAELARR